MHCLTLSAIATSFITACLCLSVPSQQLLNPDLSPQPILDPCTLAESAQLNASMQLASWLECQINGFYPFPANTHWPEAHARTFSKSLRFTFNNTHYDFDGSLALYKSFNATLGSAFLPFKHGFINTLGVPNANGDKGGFVYMIGWAGGFQRRAKRDMYFTNAAFAVVAEEDGERKIVEFRESGNIPNTAVLPEPVDWGCEFK
ncbi:hypothetical protein J1614_000842 [Plenodomus biglobosus]|nr:hypothetical protein J1614_000842 [Plenodomus biglobosus]